MAVQHRTGAAIIHAADLSPADVAAHEAASYVRHTPVSLPMPERLVENFDSYGSYWGVDTVSATLRGIADARTSGAHVDEWDVTDRAGRPMRVVRVVDPESLDDILAIPLLPSTAGA